MIRLISCITCCLSSISPTVISIYLCRRKSTLVKQIKEPLADKNGLFIEGKFDSSARPDKVLASALDSFFADINASNATENAYMSMRWRISDAVGSGVSCLYGSIPSLRQFMGDGTEVGSSERRKIAGNSLDQRLKYMLCKLISAISCRFQTLVLVLDDLQVSVRVRFLFRLHEFFGLLIFIC